MDAQQVQHVTVTISDWLIIVSTLLGPILAVQAQKWIERAYETKRRKRHVFETIMGTRGDVLSYEHKRALNQIDFVFAKEKKVLNAWHTYFDHLSTQINQANAQVEMAERKRRFVKMLQEMSSSVGYDIDDRTFENGYYAPQGHINLERDQDRIREGLIAILDGEPLNMNVTGFPVDDQATEKMKEFHEALSRTVAKDGSLKVTVSAKDDAPKESPLRALHRLPTSGDNK